MKVSSLVVVALLIATQLACTQNSSSATAPTSTSPVFSVFAPTTLSLAVGDSTQIRAVVVSADNTQRLITTSGTWVSANETVATVTSAGVVTALAPGTADITVTVSEGKATVAVSVSNNSPPTTFVGVAAAPDNETATLKFSAASPPQLSGTVYFRRLALSLNGRFDEQTHVVDLSGGGFRFLGVADGHVVAGAYVDSLGRTGGFTAIDATHIAVTAYCGSYTSDGNTALGNADAGAIVLVVSSDGTTAASALAADASGAPQAFAGRTDGDQVSLIGKTGEVLQGQLQGDHAAGGFFTAGGSSATFTIASSACH